MNNSEGQTQEPVGGMKWVSASDRLPEDNDSYHIQYEGYKDIAYCESGEWYNAGTDNLLPKAFVNNLEWLDENYTPPPSPVGIDVEALAKQKAKEKYPGEMNMMGYKINAQKNNQEKFIEGFKAGYSTPPPAPIKTEGEDENKNIAESIFENYHDMIKKYSLVIVEAEIRKEDGEFFFDTASLKENIAILAGYLPEEMIVEAFEDFDFSDVDKEGCWHIDALLSHQPAQYGDFGMCEMRDYAYIEFKKLFYRCSFEEREREVAEFNELKDTDLFGNKIAPAPPSPVGIDVDHEAEKEVMMQAFDKVYKMFQARSWIMDGRGSYPYNDDRYKEEVRYLFDEFESLHKDTWANIKSKSVDFRKKVIEQYKKDLENPYIRLSEAASLPQSSTEEENLQDWGDVIDDINEGWLTLKLKEKYKISKR